MLTERYRPESLDAVAGQHKAKAVLSRLMERGLGGRAFWLSGPSGTGKTTLAWIIARHLADDWCIEEVDAAGLTPAKLADIERGFSCKGLGKGGRALLVNEAHGLRKDTVRQFLVMLERLPKHTLIVFTTTNAGQKSLFDDNIDADPLLSRCIVLPMSTADETLLEFACHAREVAQAEGLDGQPIDAYLALVRKHKGNLRAVLNEIEAGVFV